MTLLLPAPRPSKTPETESPAAHLSVELEVPEETDSTFRMNLSVKLHKGEAGKSSVVIPLTRPPRVDKESLTPPQPKSPTSLTKGREALNAIALFMVLVGSSMLAVGVVAFLLFR